MDSKTEIAWNLLTELRKEIVELQKIRAQVIGFKITFVSGGIGIILANYQSIGIELLVIPAFAAIFFDFLINSYSVGIKRCAYYTRMYLEPKIRVYSGWPSDEPLWEGFMNRPQSRQLFSMVGNLGITVLTVATAVFGLWRSSLSPSTSVFVATILIVFFLYDIVGYFEPRRTDYSASTENPS